MVLGTNAGSAEPCAAQGNVTCRKRGHMLRDWERVPKHSLKLSRWGKDVIKCPQWERKVCG